MPSRNTHKYLSMTQAGMAAYMHNCAGDLFDSVITAATMVAEADGLIDPVERSQLLVFLNHTVLWAVITREQVLDAFEDRTRQLAERRGAEVAIGSLKRLRGRSLARLVFDAGRCVAAADGCLHPAELRTLALMCIALGSRSQFRRSKTSLS